MSTRSVVRAALAVASSLSILGFVSPSLAAQRTFVSTGGNDANACSLAAPCRGFAKAITVTDPGGELVVLDSGGYGSVTINRNVTLVSPAGVYAGISVFGGADGITVAAPATKVVLRGLTINGQGGNNGVRVQAGEVHLESLVISNLAQAGIRVEGGSTVRISGTVSRSNADGLRIVPGAGTVSVLVRDSEFSNNATAGIGVSPNAGGANAQVTVERSSVTKNGAGVVAAPGASAQSTVVVTQSVLSENAAAGVSSTGSTATVFVRESAITRNGTGLLQASSGVLNACGANLLVANTTAQSGSILTSSCLDVASGGGTVANLTQGTGITLTPSPITSTGTIAADATYLQRRVSGTCAVGSSIRTINPDGTVVCEADDLGAGTVTSVATGTGLTGGPIVTTGTVSIASGGVGNAQLANASVDVAKLNTTSTDARYHKQGGDAYGATTVVGTKDSQDLLLIAGNASALRLMPGGGQSPNVVGGNSSNTVAAGLNGQTIGGGGRTGSTCYDPATATFVRPCENVTNANYATIGGGVANKALVSTSTIAGGASNTANADSSTIGGGTGNTTANTHATIAGGVLNRADNWASVIGGGESNKAAGDWTVVGGGQTNTASAKHATISGGVLNIADHMATVVGGGESNSVTDDYSVVGGGYLNAASAFAGTIAGGWKHSATGQYATIGGGCCNTVDGYESTAGGGASNTVTGNWATVPGGRYNVASGDGSLAAGWGSTAGGAGSFAMGVGANASHANSFVWNGWDNAVGSGPVTPANSFAPNRFHIGGQGGLSIDYGAPRGDGGGTAWIVIGNGFAGQAIATYTGAFLSTDGHWVDSSDATKKTDFIAIDARDVLARVTRLPITTWRHIEESEGRRHLGPMAQDFWAEFRLGDDDRHIGVIDESGVALAAIQGLNAKVEQQAAELDALRAELAALRRTIAGSAATVAAAAP